MEKAQVSCLQPSLEMLDPFPPAGPLQLGAARPVVSVSLGAGKLLQFPQPF